MSKKKSVNQEGTQEPGQTSQNTEGTQEPGQTSQNTEGTQDDSDDEDRSRTLKNGFYDQTSGIVIPAGSHTKDYPKVDFTFAVLIGEDDEEN